MSTTQNLADRARQAWAQKQARDAEWGLWANVSDLPHLRELMAWFCEGKLSFTPGHNGPRDSETEGAVGAALAHANRSGFLTTNSQNGGDDRGDQWRSYVLGLADDATVAALRAAVDGTRLAMQATAQRFFGQDGTTPGTHQKPDGTAWGPNPVPSWRDTVRDFHGIPDEVMSQVTHLNYVQIVDSQWGPSDLLWDCLSALGKDKPSAARSTEDWVMPPNSDVAIPPEPPVGTVLGTRDSIDDYRIEHTDLGWHIQYRDGESEFGERLTSFGGRGISWPAAWKAWGPPAGAEPFTVVPPDAPPLPPHPSEDPPPWVDMGPDASGQHVDPPPPAEPYRPTKPTAPSAKTTPTTTGAAMTSGVSYGGLKAVIMGATERIPEHGGGLQQVIAGIDGEIAQLLAANEDSGKLDEAIALLMQAKEKLEEAAASLGAAVQSADSAAAALS